MCWLLNCSTIKTDLKYQSCQLILDYCSYRWATFHFLIRLTCGVNYKNHKLIDFETLSLIKIQQHFFFWLNQRICHSVPIFNQIKLSKGLNLGQVFSSQYLRKLSNCVILQVILTLSKGLKTAHKLACIKKPFSGCQQQSCRSPKLFNWRVIFCVR